MAWSGLLSSPYNSTTESIFALNENYRKRVEDNIVYEWGIDIPVQAPKIEAGDGTGLTGDYNVKYTWCRKERRTVVSESNASQAADSAVTLVDNDLKVTFPVPEDKQVNSVRFYRTWDNAPAAYWFDKDVTYVNLDYSVTQDWEESDEYFSGNAFRFTVIDSTHDMENCFIWEELYNGYTMNEVAAWVTTGKGDNVMFVYLDQSDASLGSAVHTDHDRPPKGHFTFGPSHNGTLFMLKDHRLYYSLPKQPEYWPADYYVEVSSVTYKPLCGVIYDKQPYVLTKNKIYFIYGTAPSDWRPKDMAAKCGAQNGSGAVAVEGHGIFHTGPDGVYLFGPSTDWKHGRDDNITKSLSSIFRGENKNGVNAVGDLSKSWLSYWNDKVYFGYPGVYDTYPTNMLVFFLSEKKIGYYTRNEEINAIAVDYYNDRLITVDNSGYAWEIECKTATDDDGTDIDWEIQSKDFTLQTRQHFPRFVKYDINSVDAASANGGLLLDSKDGQDLDQAHQVHALSDNRNTKRRLVDVGNGERCSLAAWGLGRVEIYAMESQ